MTTETKWEVANGDRWGHTAAIGKVYAEVEQQLNDYDSPRDWDNLGTLAYRDAQWISGDQQSSLAKNWKRITDLYCTNLTLEMLAASMVEVDSGWYDGNWKVSWKDTEDYRVLMTVHYIHGNTGRMVIGDSAVGQAQCRALLKTILAGGGDGDGIYALTREELEAKYGKVTRSTLLKATQAMHSELKTYSQWLEGEVYTITVYDEGETLESCGGFYGEDYALEEAEAMLLHHASIKDRETQAVREWAKSMGETLNEVMIPMEVAV
jgi:hypothetical protein